MKFFLRTTLFTVGFFASAYSMDLYCYEDKQNKYTYIDKYDHITWNKKKNAYETNDFTHLQHACQLISPTAIPVVRGYLYGHYELIDYTPQIPEVQNKIRVTCSGVKIDKPYFLELDELVSALYLSINSKQGEYLLNNNSLNELKQQCAKGLNKNFLNETWFTSENVYITYFNDSAKRNYPISDFNLQKIAQRTIKEKQDLYAKNNAKILSYAISSKNAYNLEKNSQIIPPENYERLETLAVQENELNNQKLYAIGFINKTTKEIVISYKGTNPNNYNDIANDIYLMINNITSMPHLTNTILDALNFNNKIKLMYPEYKITLTGHSLGGYIAQMVALNTGENSIVFSAPSASLYSNYFSYKYIPTFYNVLNIVRNYDPVVFGSGRHFENMLYFDNITSNPHTLTDSIEILNQGILPQYAYFYGKNNITNNDLFTFDKFNNTSLYILE